MNLRTTLIIAVLLAGLGAYAYFVEYKGGAKKEEAKEKEKTLLEIKREDVKEIRLDWPEQPIRIAATGKDIWQITSPLQSRADQATVDRILGAFEKLKYQQIIEQQPKNLSGYELDQPKHTIHLVSKKSERTIQIGAKNPVESVYYVRLNNDPRVYTVDSTVGDLSSITLLDLRDKKLTDFSTDKVQSLNLQTANLDLQFEKQGDVWKMKKPVESPASESEVTSLLSSLETLQASKFIDQPSPDLTTYGFNPPAATLELSLEKGLHQKIIFGKKEGEELYCRVEGNPSIATVTDSFTTTFDKKLEDWREKKLVVFNRFDTDEARIKSDGKEYVFQKGAEEKWNQTSPVKGEVDAEKVQDLLEKLETVEIAKYGTESSVSTPGAMEVVLSLKDWQDKVTKKHLTFGPVKDNLQQVKNDDYATIVYAQPALQQELLKALSEIKPKPPVPPAAKPKK
jgi:hypothetical protein